VVGLELVVQRALLASMVERPALLVSKAVRAALVPGATLSPQAFLACSWDGLVGVARRQAGLRHRRHAQHALDDRRAARAGTVVLSRPWLTDELLGLELHTELYPLDSPGLVQVEFDGAPIAFTPSAPAPGVLALAFERKATRIVRVIASDHGQPVPQFMDQLAWWSIYEIKATCSASAE
jgi:hypothetical protein